MMSVRQALADSWSRMTSRPGLGRNILALSGLIVIGVITAIILLSNLSYFGPFSSRTSFRVEFADAIGVSPGNGQEVRVAGVKVGEIEASEPTDHNTSIVTVSTDPSVPIYANARAALRAVNPLNQMYIEINQGDSSAPRLDDDALIPVTQTERPIQVDEVLNKLDDRARPALTALLEESDNALVNAPRTLPSGLATADQTMITLKPVVDQLQTRSENIRKLVSGLSSISTTLGGNDARLVGLVDSTQKTLDVLSSRNQELDKVLSQLPGTTEAVRNALNSTSRLGDQLDPTLNSVKDASDSLPDALASVHGAIQPLRDTTGPLADVVRKAQPIVKDLRPIVGDVNPSLVDLGPVSRCLDDVTSKVAPWTYDLSAFMYNTNSTFSVRDANGIFGRGQATAATNSPTGAQVPNEANTNTYQQGESPLGPYPAIGSGDCHR